MYTGRGLCAIFNFLVRLLFKCDWWSSLWAKRWSSISERFGESGATHDSQSPSRSGVEARVAQNLNGWDDFDAGLSQGWVRCPSGLASLHHSCLSTRSPYQLYSYSGNRRVCYDNHGSFVYVSPNLYCGPFFQVRFGPDSPNLSNSVYQSWPRGQRGREAGKGKRKRKKWRFFNQHEKILKNTKVGIPTESFSWHCWWASLWGELTSIYGLGQQASSLRNYLPLFPWPYVVATLCSLVEWNLFSVVPGCTRVTCISDIREPISLHQAVLLLYLPSFERQINGKLPACSQTWSKPRPNGERDHVDILSTKQTKGWNNTWFWKSGQQQRWW